MFLFRLAKGSLTRRLLAVMLVPLIGLALLLGLGGTIMIRNSVEAVNDRILGAASQALADSLSVEDGEIALNLSPAIFGMLEDNERDNVYYSVRNAGGLVTGYSDLPDIAPGGLGDTQTRFETVEYNGRPVRIVAEGRRLTGLGRPTVVEIAETLDARQQVERRMLLGLSILEIALITLTLMMLPWAVRWGMRPLVRLRAEVDQRAAADLTPLATDDIPSEIRDLVGAFNGLLERLKATLLGMRRFTADASHQMRTPLSILRTHISLLRRAQCDGADAARTIDEIDEASARLQRLLVQLLALARADSATVGYALETVGANELVATVAADHAAQAVQADVKLRFEPIADKSGAVVMLTTNVMLATELLGNLIDNAIRYNNRDGHVVISLATDDAGVTVTIDDDGPGIPAEDRSRVFERFTRLDSSRERSGSGLGLSIAFAIAKAIGARVTLDSPPSGSGLRALVYFPNSPQTDSVMTAFPN